MTDSVNKSGDLIDKSWALPELLVNDAIKVLKGVSNLKEVSENAEQTTTPPSK